MVLDLHREADRRVMAGANDTVVSTHRGTAERGAQKLEATETMTFTIRNGKIAKIVSSFSPEDEKAEDAFWGKG
jgi:hypothetical protein